MSEAIVSTKRLKEMSEDSDTYTPEEMAIFNELFHTRMFMKTTRQISEAQVLEAFAYGIQVEDASGWTTGHRIRDFLFRPESCK